MSKNNRDIVNNLGFMSRALAQTSIPHSNLLDTTIFTRKSGQHSLTIVGSEFGLPYGTYPRLLLAWICSESVKTKSPTLHLGTKQSDFLKKLNISRQGSTIAMLKNQTNRLLNSTFRITFDNTNTRANKRFLIASSDIEFWEPQTGDWEAYLKLSKDFFEDIIENPVPIDMNVLNSIRKSPLTIDVYTWLVYRTYLVHIQGGRPVKISWSDLQAQFGSNYGVSITDTLTSDEMLKKEQRALINFRSNFLTALKKLQTFYPELNQIISSDSQFLTISGAKLIK